MELTRKYRRRTLDELESPLLRSFLGVWRSHCGERRFPSRNDLRPRELAPVMAHLTLARVMEGGEDFELRIIGNEIVQAYGENYTGRRLSSLRQLIGAEMDDAYHAVLHEAQPVLLEGWFEIAAERCLHREVLLTPLGDSDHAVDHILTAGALSHNPVSRLNIVVSDAAPAAETSRTLRAAS